ncbi:MAG: hypothetical protein N3B18_08465 [Desulfobacterota bacterium]|nr:hypothetical protein [Thermodesulfobacteriota bacterium]
MRDRTVVRLDEVRAKKTTPLTRLLKDHVKVAQAIESRTCLVCQSVKACVNRAGVCSYCFEHVLTPEEQAVAREEAKHKIITIRVLDDRFDT